MSEKVANATAAGAIRVVVDNNIPGDPPNFSKGNNGALGASRFATSIVISQELGDAIRGAAAVSTGTISHSRRLSLTGSVVTTSSRGPNPGYTLIKPELAAPGASVAAVAGTGPVRLRLVERPAQRR